jgi:hypothetical protein
MVYYLLHRFRKRQSANSVNIHNFPQCLHCIEHILAYAHTRKRTHLRQFFEPRSLVDSDTHTAFDGRVQSAHTQRARAHARTTAQPDRAQQSACSRASTRASRRDTRPIARTSTMRHVSQYTQQRRVTTTPQHTCLNKKLVMYSCVDSFGSGCWPVIVCGGAHGRSMHAHAYTHITALCTRRTQHAQTHAPRQPTRQMTTRRSPTSTVWLERLLVLPT